VARMLCDLLTLLPHVLAADTFWIRCVH